MAVNCENGADPNAAVKAEPPARTTDRTEVFLRHDSRWLTSTGSRLLPRTLSLQFRVTLLKLRSQLVMLSIRNRRSRRGCSRGLVAHMQGRLSINASILQVPITRTGGPGTTQSLGGA